MKLRSERARIAFELRTAGLTFKEIGARLGISTSLACQLYKKALLRQQDDALREIAIPIIREIVSSGKPSLVKIAQALEKYGIEPVPGHDKRRSRSIRALLRDAGLCGTSALGYSLSVSDEELSISDEDLIGLPEEVIAELSRDAQQRARSLRSQITSEIG